MEIKAFLHSLKIKKALGMMEAATKFLRRLAVILHTLLVTLINRSIETEYVPEVLKIAKILPLY